MATINVSHSRPTGLPATTRPRRKPPLAARVRKNAVGYVFLAGAVLCFALFSWYPIVREVIMSFQKTNFAGDTTWVGTKNFTRISHDPEFWSAWRQTVEFSLLALVFGYAVPFVTAIVLNELRHARSYFRLLVYLPVMMPPAAAAFLWQWFYDPGDGLFNTVLRDLHLPTSQWLQSTNTAMVSLVFFSTWINMGGGTLIYLASLQGIPGELYEAAELEGAGVLRRIWHVTIPQTRLILSLLLMLQIVATMQVFLEPFILTGGGPEGKTTTVVYLIYEYAFHFNNYGSAAALGLVLLVVLAIFGAVYLWLSRRGEEA
ncbi:MAG: multiple sugar transport system permease protein [Actinomycetota bacterium]|nr:multiple sugar transport system permease protein [Actinomycetota bacterium]